MIVLCDRAAGFVIVLCGMAALDYDRVFCETVTSAGSLYHEKPEGVMVYRGACYCYYYELLPIS